MHRDGITRPPRSRRRASNSWCIFPIILHLDIKFQGTREGRGEEGIRFERNFLQDPFLPLSPLHFEQGWIYRWTDITGLKPFFIRSDRYLWKRGRFFRWRDRCVIEGIRGEFFVSIRMGGGDREDFWFIELRSLYVQDQIFRRTFAENGLFFFDFRRFSALDSLDLWNE